MKLKKCPCCGGKAQVKKERFYDDCGKLSLPIYCVNCIRCLLRIYSMTKFTAMDLWNCRKEG